jgi:hypothetical protein
MKSILLIGLTLLSIVAADLRTWEYSGGNIMFSDIRREDTGSLASMETMVYHYFEKEDATDPILTVEYLRTPYQTFARSFHLLKGVFEKNESGTKFQYNTVEVCMLTQTIIYLMNDEVVHVHPHASPDELVAYVEDERKKRRF